MDDHPEQLADELETRRDGRSTLVAATGDLSTSKTLDFQAPWHHFQFVRLFG